MGRSTDVWRASQRSLTFGRPLICMVCSSGDRGGIEWNRLPDFTKPVPREGPLVRAVKRVTTLAILRDERARFGGSRLPKCRRQCNYARATKPPSSPMTPQGINESVAQHLLRCSPILNALQKIVRASFHFAFCISGSLLGNASQSGAS